MSAEQRTNNQWGADPDFNALRDAAKKAQVAAATAVEDLRIANGRLRGAARPVCSKCARLRYSVEFNYTYCPELGDVSGSWRPLSDIARLVGGKFECSHFKAGGELEGTP